MPSLTAKQERFVAEYLVDLNATQAAVRAGFSEKTAGQKGHEFTTKHPGIMAAISAAKAGRAERTRIDADWVLTRLAREADADLADLYAEDGSLRPIQDWPDIWRKGLVAGLDVEEVREDGVVIAVVRKVKFSDRIKRIELIGKHVNVQAFKDQVEHTGGIALTVNQEDAEL